MRSEGLNSRVLALDDSHPAKKFLSAFMECRSNCVGLEIDPDEPIDQQWQSVSEDRVWTFSGFAYTFLSLDIDLDDFHQRNPSSTELNSDWPWNVPRLRCLMLECAEAARQSGNDEILELTDQVLEMLGLWEEYLKFRRDMISHAHD